MDSHKLPKELPIPADDGACNHLNNFKIIDLLYMFCNLMTDQCIILAGGVGSRLGKITKKTPKPLINVNNRPFINYIIKLF